jgi:hypothetical protein
LRNTINHIKKEIEKLRRKKYTNKGVVMESLLLVENFRGEN